MSDQMAMDFGGHGLESRADWRRIDTDPPGAADVDEWGCVLIWHNLNGLMLTNPKNVAFYGEHVKYWAHTPKGPEGME